METIKIERNIDLLNYLFDNIIQEEGFICGGFARYCCSPKKNPTIAKDIDVYCFENSFESIKQRLFSLGYSIQFESDIAISYKYLFSNDKIPIQLIKPINVGNIVATGTIETILNNFDFTIARCGIYKKENILTAIADNDFLKDEKKKTLQIKNIHCPVAQVYRVSKYMEKGYRLPTLEVVKILEDWVQRDDTYKSKLLSFLTKENPTQDEIQHMEKLLHID
jgi:hypothetical protein